jgi:hypothetical protein
MEGLSMKEDLAAAPATMVLIKKKNPLSAMKKRNFVMGKATGGALEAIQANEMSSVVQDVLLVYPFLGVDNVGKASAGLPLCNTGDSVTCSQLISSLSLRCSNKPICKNLLFVMNFVQALLYGEPQESLTRFPT